MRPNLSRQCWDWGWNWGWNWGQGGRDRVRVWRRKNSSRSGKKTLLQRRLHLREDWVLWRRFSIRKWRVNVFEANHTFEEFEDDHELQRRLDFREDWEFWRTFLIGKWRVNEKKKFMSIWKENFTSEKTSFQRRPSTLDKIFDREMKSEWMYSKPTTPSKSSKTTKSFREALISEKIGNSGERFRSENEEWMKKNSSWSRKKTSLQRRLHFREEFISEKIGNSGERFRSENEEWMKKKNSSRPRKKTFLQRRLQFREDWVLWRTFSFGKWRVNEEWMKGNVALKPFRATFFLWGRNSSHGNWRRLCTLENVFVREMKSECIQTYYVTWLAI